MMITKPLALSLAHNKHCINIHCCYYHDDFTYVLVPTIKKFLFITNLNSQFIFSPILSIMELTRTNVMHNSDPGKK